MATVATELLVAGIGLGGLSVRCLWLFVQLGLNVCNWDESCGHGVWIAQHPVFIQHPVSSEEIWLCREKLIEVDVEDGGVDVVGWIDQE